MEMKMELMDRWNKRWLREGEIHFYRRGYCNKIEKMEYNENVFDTRSPAKEKFYLSMNFDFAEKKKMT